MFLELRLSPGKFKLKGLISSIKKELSLGYGSDVPHISLYGEFHTHKVDQVIDLISSIGSKYGYLPFTINGLDLSEKEDCLVLKVYPSESLKRLRNELVGALEDIAPSENYWDKKEHEHWFHITVKNHIYGKKFNLDEGMLVLRGSEENKPLLTTHPYLPMVALRLTLLNDYRKIMCEYDLMQKVLMTRNQALDRSEWTKTLRIFRLKTGMELQERIIHEDKKIFLIGDLHLDHKNIIGYCGRPFYDINTMNKVLVNNWNMTINDIDTVYFLGDLSYGKGSRSKDYWLKQLSGDVHFISGNHERNLTGTNIYEILKYKGYDFLFVHDPEDIPYEFKEWKGWIIHGHKHNNKLWEYPFINGIKKTVNVSAEVIKYRPLDLDYLISLDINSIKRMDLISSPPERF